MTHLFPNGWVHYLGGGIVIGLGVSLLFALTGYIGGVSTAYSALCSYFSQWPHFQHERFVTTRTWRLMYAMGMIFGALAFTYSMNGGKGFVTQVPPWQLLLGGVLGGIGTRMSGGCTTGHGICGLGSFQLPSLLAVITFLCTAILTAHLVQMFGGF